MRENARAIKGQIEPHIELSRAEFLSERHPVLEASDFIEIVGNDLVDPSGSAEKFLGVT